MIRRYLVAVVREGSGYWAFLPDVPGVYGRGDSGDAATTDATEALADYLVFLREQGEAPPDAASDALEARFAEVPA